MVVVVVVVIFTVIAGCSVLIPVIGYLVTSVAMSAPLEALRT